MNKFIYKLFIKDYDKTDDPQVRESYGKLAGIVGLISNLFLCIIKIFAGILTSSIAIIADGINNLADAASSVITLIGFRLAAMPEDDRHPYGHARFEYITGLIISIIIIIVGIDLGESSISKIIHPESLAVSDLSIGILVIAIVVKIWQSAFNFSIGKTIDSTAVKATAKDSRNDVISTCVVLISILLSRFAGINIDGILGTLVAVFIIMSGISLIRETSSPLLGEAPDEELVQAIKDYAMKYDQVLGVHDLIVHNYGPDKVFASMHIEVDSRKDILESHDVVDNIEKDLKKNLKIHFVAHLDPVNPDDPIINQVKEPILKYLKEYDNILSIHDIRCITGPTHTNIVLDAVKGPDCVHSNADIMIYVNRKIQETYPDYSVIITFDKECWNLV